MKGQCDWCEQHASLTRIISHNPIQPFEWVCAVCAVFATVERLRIWSDMWDMHGDGHRDRRTSAA